MHALFSLERETASKLTLLTLGVPTKDSSALARVEWSRVGRILWGRGWEKLGGQSGL